MPGSDRKTPGGLDRPRPRAVRIAWVAALVAGGGLIFWATFQVEQRLTSPKLVPRKRMVTFEVLVSDGDTSKAVSEAQVGIDQETGDYDHPGPSWDGITDAGGRLRLVRGFGANTVLREDGNVRGRVNFTGGGSTPLSYSSYFLVVRASGYREEKINLERMFPRGIDFEDTSPRTIRVPLFRSSAP